MTRKRQVAGNNLVVAGSPTWTDYDGDEAYGDFAWNPQTQSPQDTMSYLPGIGEKDLSNGTVVYYHADQVGSLRVATDAAGNVVGRYVYTAFGEPICGGAEGPTCGTDIAPYQTRYKWCGAYQYETNLGADSGGGGALPFTRIGHRWYDPATGRFIQRDPLGIDGGLNTYTYCVNNPVEDNDPEGLWPPQYDEIRGHGYGRVTSFVATCMVYSGQAMGLEDIWDAGEGRDRYGGKLTGGQRVWRGGKGALKLVSASAGVAGGVRAALGPLPRGPSNPWIGAAEVHGAHAGGPHQFPHLQLMLRTGQHATSSVRMGLPYGPLPGGKWIIF